MSLQGVLYERRLIWRHRMGQGFEWLCRLSTLAALAIVLLLLGSILFKALSPGRGKGLAAVSLPDSETSDPQSDELSYSVSNIFGGQFEDKNQPGLRKNVLTMMVGDLPPFLI